MVQICKEPRKEDMINELDRQAIKAGSWYIISNVVAKGILVSFTPIFSRLLSKEAFGEYSNFLSWLHILTIICTFNLSSTILRANLDYKTKKSYNTYVFSIMIFSTILPVLVSSMFFLIKDIFLISLNMSDNLLIYLFIMTAFSSQIQSFQAKERAYLRYRDVSIITILYAITSILFPFIMTFFSGDSLKNILLGMTLNAFLWGGGLLLREYAQERESVNLKCINYALNLGLPLVPHTLASIIMGNSDKIMIMSICGAEAAAMYSVSYTCSLAITLLRNSSGYAWSSWFYNTFNNGDLVAIRKVSSLFIIIGAIGILIICFLSPEIILLLGGERYYESRYLMPMIMLGCFYDFLNLFYIDIEFYYKKVRMISVITISAGIINVLLNYYGIIWFGYIAAPFTTAIVNGGIVFSHYMITRKYNNWIIFDNKIFLGSAILITIISLNLHHIYNLIVPRYSIVGILLVGLMLLIKNVYSTIFCP